MCIFVLVMLAVTAVYTLLIQWFEISKLQCALASLSLKFRLCAEPLEHRTLRDRVARAYEAVHIYGDTSEHKHE
jgi:hypothetical protein